MRTITPSIPSSDTGKAPRIKRSTAAVIAQYIQDLTSPTAPANCPA